MCLAIKETNSQAPNHKGMRCGERQPLGLHGASQLNEAEVFAFHAGWGYLIYTSQDLIN